MRVLQFAPRAPWPLDTGAKLRNYHLARVLAQQANITLLCFYEQAKNTMPLPEIYPRLIKVPFDQPYSFKKIIQGAFGKTPLPLLNYTSEQMMRKLASLLAEDHFDIVQVESIHLMNNLPIIQAARNRPLVVCDWHNVESDLMFQYAGSEYNVARKAYARRTARLMKEFEQRALGEFDAHLTVSEADAERLRGINPQARILVIENGVDVAYYTNDEETIRRNRVVFVGSMDYHANIEGVVDFARHVWPALHAQKPEIVFTIVGRDPAPAVRKLTSIAGVEVTGSVDDVRPYYREAIASVVPLSVGGGSRLKILEAMASGVPVVSTARGAEGLQVRDGENILLVDATQQLAATIAKLIDTDEVRERIIHGGRKLVTENYDWQKLGAMLFEHYRQLVSRRSSATTSN